MDIFKFGRTVELARPITLGKASEEFIGCPGRDIGCPVDGFVNLICPVFVMEMEGVGFPTALVMVGCVVAGGATSYFCI